MGLFRAIGNICMTGVKLLFLPILVGIGGALLGSILFGETMAGLLLGMFVGFILSFKRTFK